MARRHLSPEERALWSALSQSVRPLRPAVQMAEPPTRTQPAARQPVKSVATPSLAAPAPTPRTPAKVLDAGWERRIRGGTLVPDMTIDLHGYSLAAAHARLNQALAVALARDARIVLIITGKPPKSADAAPGSQRGAIRGEIGHWLETSSYADRIASVRVAHPRHGGQGAIYVILRRRK